MQLRPRMLFCPSSLRRWPGRTDEPRSPARLRCHVRDGSAPMKTTVVAHLIPMVLGLLASPLHAQTPLHDSNLPGAEPEALQQLSDNRVRQYIIRESQAPYGGRCVCQYQIKDTNGHSCKSRHEVIRVHPQPLCYPGQVTGEMVSVWRQHHP